MEEKYIVFVNPSFKTDTYRDMRNARKTGERLILEKNSRWGFADYGESVPYPFIAKLFDVSVYRVKKAPVKYRGIFYEPRVSFFLSRCGSIYQSKSRGLVKIFARKYIRKKGIFSIYNQKQLN